MAALYPDESAPQGDDDGVATALVGADLPGRARYLWPRCAVAGQQGHGDHPALSGGSVGARRSPLDVGGRVRDAQGHVGPRRDGPTRRAFLEGVHDEVLGQSVVLDEAGQGGGLEAQPVPEAGLGGGLPGFGEGVRRTVVAAAAASAHGQQGVQDVHRLRWQGQAGEGLVPDLVVGQLRHGFDDASARALPAPSWAEETAQVPDDLPVIPRSARDHVWCVGNGGPRGRRLLDSVTVTEVLTRQLSPMS